MHLAAENRWTPPSREGPYSPAEEIGFPVCGSEVAGGERVSRSRLKKENYPMEDRVIVSPPPTPAPETLPVGLSNRPPHAPRLVLKIEELEARLAPGGARGGVDF
jgi:hypothetical protein